MHTEGSVRVFAFADILVIEIDACAVVGGAQPVGIHHRRVELKPRKCQMVFLQDGIDEMSSGTGVRVTCTDERHNAPRRAG